MRAGAGWVRAAVPASLNEIFEVKLTEVMTRAAARRRRPPGQRGRRSRAGGGRAGRRGRARPGAGPRGRARSTLAQRLVEQLEPPLLVDADGLNALAERGARARPAAPRGAAVLTPHAGELARLLGTESADVEARRLASAREAAARAGAVVVLKGDDTLVARPGTAALARQPRRQPGARDRGHRRRALRRDRGVHRAGASTPSTAACAGVLRARGGRPRSRPRGSGADSVIASDVIDGAARSARDRWRSVAAR